MALWTAEIQAIKCKSKIYSMGASFCIAEHQDSRTYQNTPQQSSGLLRQYGCKHSQGNTLKLSLLYLMREIALLKVSFLAALCPMPYTAWSELETLDTHHNHSIIQYKHRWREAVLNTHDPSHRRLLLHILEILDAECSCSYIFMLQLSQSQCQYHSFLFCKTKSFLLFLQVPQTKHFKPS